jgi:hypothetical protein
MIDKDAATNIERIDHHGQTNARHPDRHRALRRRADFDRL